MTATGPRLKVLVVEDDPDELELFGDVLQAHGFETRLVGTVAEGLAALAEGDVFLVLADYNLPDGTGTAMLREARRRGHLEGVKAYLTTAYPFPDRDADMGLLVKPVDVATLVSVAHDARSPPSTPPSG